MQTDRASQFSESRRESHRERESVSSQVARVCTTDNTDAGDRRQESSRPSSQNLSPRITSSWEKAACRRQIHLENSWPRASVPCFSTATTTTNIFRSRAPHGDHEHRSAFLASFKLPCSTPTEVVTSLVGLLRAPSIYHYARTSWSELLCALV